MRSLKKTALLTAVLVATLMCDGIDNINVDNEGTTTVPMRTVIDELLGPLSFAGFQGFDISESQEFQNGGYTKDQIDSVRLSSLSLEVTRPDDGNFDFLDGISFFAEAPGLPEVEIARLDPVPEGETQLDMEILDVELVEYAVAESMTITTSASGVRPEQETDILGRVILNVDINVGGSLGCQVAVPLR